MALATAVILMKGARLRLKSDILATGIAGFLSGFLNGSISMSGPPIVLFLANRGDRKELFRGNLSTFAVGINAATLLSFAIAGLVTTDVIRTVAELLPSVLLGTITGGVLTKRINETLFRRIVLLLVVITGLATMATSAGRIAGR